MSDRSAAARASEAQEAYRRAAAAATPRLRALEAAHGCAFEGCSRFGSFGFGPPSYGPPARWACAEHRAAVRDAPVVRGT